VIVEDTLAPADVHDRWVAGHDLLVGVGQGATVVGDTGYRSPALREESRQDAALAEKIREIHLRSRETYGSPRVHAELRDIGRHKDSLLPEGGPRGSCARPG
jgi:putative transposase